MEAAVGGGNMRNLTENDGTVVPANLNQTTSIAFARTPSEVLSIVYLCVLSSLSAILTLTRNAAGKSGLSSGGFFPRGLNGNIRSTS